jgi:hypothetical protein
LSSCGRTASTSAEPAFGSVAATVAPKPGAIVRSAATT